MNNRELVSSLFLIFYSIKLSFEKFRFVHRDLHIDNIIMREINDEENTYIKIPETEILVNTYNIIPTIFDFGMSSFEKDNKIYGNYDFLNYCLDPRKSDPLIDVCKILLQIHSKIKSEIIERLLYKIFENEKTIDYLIEEYSIVPDTKLFENISVDDMINELKNIIEEYGYDDLITKDNKKELKIIDLSKVNEDKKIRERKEELFTRNEVMSVIDLEYYYNKEILKKEEISEIENYINLYVQNLIIYNYKAPNLNIVKNNTLIQKFYEIYNTLYIAKINLGIIGKLQKKYKNIIKIYDAVELIQRYIEEHEEILEIYRKNAKLIKNSYRSPKNINNKIKKYLKNIKYKK
jgi:hypothetical protein